MWGKFFSRFQFARESFLGIGCWIFFSTLTVLGRLEMFNVPFLRYYGVVATNMEIFLWWRLFLSECDEGVQMRRKRECSGRRRKGSIWTEWAWRWRVGLLCGTRRCAKERNFLSDFFTMFKVRAVVVTGSDTKERIWYMTKVIHDDSSLKWGSSFSTDASPQRSANTFVCIWCYEWMKQVYPIWLYDGLLRLKIFIPYRITTVWYVQRFVHSINPGCRYMNTLSFTRWIAHERKLQDKWVPVTELSDLYCFKCRGKFYCSLFSLPETSCSTLPLHVLNQILNKHSVSNTRQIPYLQFQYQPSTFRRHTAKFWTSASISPCLLFSLHFLTNILLTHVEPKHHAPKSLHSGKALPSNPYIP